MSAWIQCETCGEMAERQRALARFCEPCAADRRLEHARKRQREYHQRKVRSGPEFRKLLRERACERYRRPEVRERYRRPDYLQRQREYKREKTRARREANAAEFNANPRLCALRDELKETE